MDIDVLTGSYDDTHPSPCPGGEIFELTFAESSPSNPTPGVIATAYLYLLVDGVLYRSRRPYDGGAYLSWETEEIPAGVEWARVFWCWNCFKCGLISIDGLKISYKGYTSLDPTDLPFDTPIDLPEAVKLTTFEDLIPSGSGWFPSPGFDDFWDPDMQAIPLVALTRSGQTFIGTSSHAADGEFTDWTTKVCNYPLPVGYTWNKVYADPNRVPDGANDDAIAVGNGNKVARFFSSQSSGFQDDDWNLMDCPEGDWIDIIHNQWNFVMVSSDGKIAGCNDYLGSPWFEISVPAGVTPDDPRVYWDADMYDNSTTQGVFISTGWRNSSNESIVLYIKVDPGTEELATSAIAFTFPAEADGITWKRGVKPQALTGFLIAGLSASGEIRFITNPEDATSGTPDTFTDWTVKLLSEAPF